MSKRKNTFGENTAVTLLGPTGYDNVITILKYMPDLMDLYDVLLGSGGGSLTVDSIIESTPDAGITIDGQTLIKDGEATSVTFNGVPITALGSATQFLAGDGTYQTLVETDISDLDKYTQAEVDSAITAATASMNELSELTDTTITTPAIRHALMYDGVDSWDNRLLVEADVSDLDKYTQAQVDAAISAATAAMNELSELTDTVITTPAVRHALMYDGVDSWDNRLLVELDISDLDKYTQAQVDTNIGVVNTALGTHTGDTTIHFTQAAIDITASQVNDFSTAVNALVGSTDVDGLNNVTITTPALGNILVYNTTGTVWENQTLASQDIATLTAMATADGLRVATAGDTMDSAADLTFAGGGEVLGLPATPSATGAASKEYVDTQIGGAGLFVENVTHSFITGGTNAGGNLDITGLTDDSFIAGVNAVQTLTNVLGSIVIGHNAGGLLATGTLTGNTAVGFEAISGHATGSVAPGDYNSVFGYQCGAHAKGEHNVFMGYRAGFGVNAGWSGDKNVALGSLALDSASGAVSTTVAVGAGSFGLLYGTSSENVAVGNNAGAAIGGSSVQNTFLGAEAGAAIALGQRNVCVGYDAGPVSGVHNDELYISNTQTATPLIFGDFATPKVTINGALKATGALFIENAAPTYNWVESGHTVDNKNWDMVANAGVMYLRAVNDAYTVAGNALTITRSGTSITSVGIGGDIETTVNKVIDMGNWASTADHIQMYGNGGVNGYGFGVESSTVYYRSASNHRFYHGSLANGGASGVGMVLAGNDLTISGAVIANALGQINGTQPQFKLYESDAATDEKYWRFYAAGGTFVFDIHNDVNSVASNIFTVERTADDVDVINFITDMQVNKQIYFDAVVANTTATAINWTNGNKQSIAPTAATSPTYTFTAPGGPTNLTLAATNLGAATTVTWPATVKWPGGTEPTWTSSGTDIINFYYDGTNYHGAASIDSK